MPAAPLNVFISYSHNEEDKSLLDKLVKHLASLRQPEPLIHIWDDSHIRPGDPWDDEIKENLQCAHIVLLLISPDFNSSRYIREVEMTEAFARHQRKECRIVPILLRPCNFKGMPYEHLEMLPKLPADQRLEPVVDLAKWQTPDFALKAVTDRLRELIEEINMQAERPAPAPAAPASAQTPWEGFFRLLPAKRPIKLLDTVNCNRLEHYQAQLERHFETNKDRQGNILYLFTACNTQKPVSLAKRMAYWFDDKFTLFFRPQEDTRKDELTFRNLTLEKKPEQTFGNFWKEMQDHILHAPVDFDSFVQDPGRYLALPENARALLAFQIAESDFIEYKANLQIAYILEQFAQLPAAFHRFVFCFVFHFHDVHCQHRRESEYIQDVLDVLNKFTQPAADKHGWGAGLHISCLPSVPKDDLLVWWEPRLGRQSLPDAERVLLDHILPDRQDACRREGRFDMEAIEDMQYAAYTFYRDQY